MTSFDGTAASTVQDPLAACPGARAHDLDAGLHGWPPREREPVPRQPALCSVRDTLAQRFYLHVPAGCRRGAVPLVAVHGISRNAREQAAAFRMLAERHAFPVIAPIFCRQFFEGYQRLEDGTNGIRADAALDRLLADVNSRFGVSTGKIALWGFSGGAQFAHRYALLHPQRVAALALGAAGWYTMPDPRQAFPHGAGTDPEAGLAADLEGFLGVPKLVVVGEEDTRRDGSLRCDARLDSEQGAHRVARARRWSQAVDTAAEECGLSQRMCCSVLPGVGHDFAVAVRAGAALQVVSFFARQACMRWSAGTPP